MIKFHITLKVNSIGVLTMYEVGFHSIAAKSTKSYYLCQSFGFNLG